MSCSTLRALCGCGMLVLLHAPSLWATSGTSADLSITNRGDVFTTPGLSASYIITASNAPGGDPVNPATVTDTFSPQCATVSWTCQGAAGGLCIASGVGDINDTTVSLPPGGSVTYLATCAIPSSVPFTALVSTATVSGGLVFDPFPGNNSATDFTTVAPRANLGITKTDDLTGTLPGGSVTYRIVASNQGPSDAPGAVVTDFFPAACTRVAWTCAGGRCDASNGTGNIDQTINLLVGESVTYTAVCRLSATASDLLVNTARVSTGIALVSDPFQENNSATDVDFVTGRGAATPIPTLDGLGLAALALVLAVLAAGLLRKRRSA